MMLSECSRTGGAVFFRKCRIGTIGEQNLFFNIQDVQKKEIVFLFL
ncbi:unnamed protein product [Tenebrio molitor]|nr:unnamed protein product [Tenebrio molitor]